MARPSLAAFVLCLSCNPAFFSGSEAPQRNVMRWYRPETTQQDFMRDRYDCLRDAERAESRAFVNRYGGAARTGSTLSTEMFQACMGAKGYELHPNGPFAPPEGGEAWTR